jgi:predicted DNA-binding transcriptional regulator YafY
MWSWELLLENRPEHCRRLNARRRRRFANACSSVATAGGRVEQPTAIPAQIRRAVERQNRMRLVSRDRTGSVTERLVDPLGVVAKAGIW